MHDGRAFTRYYGHTDKTGQPGFRFQSGSMQLGWLVGLYLGVCVRASLLFCCLTPSLSLGLVCVLVGWNLPALDVCSGLRCLLLLFCCTLVLELPLFFRPRL